MTSLFFASFEPETLIKLQIFQGYIRNWLPVFLNKKSKRKRVHILDLFAGPGQDRNGVKGTPLLCVEAARDYCQNSAVNRNFAQVHMHFNDLDPAHVATLRTSVEDSRCHDTCCEYHFSNEDFKEAFIRIFRNLDPADPALVILDPFGFDVSIEIIQEVAQRKLTDLLLFYPSSIARRFGEPLVQRGAIPFTEAEITELREADHYHAHRVLGRFIQSRISAPGYLIAPFSIQRGSNIYGVFFGSAKMLGIEKFLTLCWKVDPKTGEANYNIDRESPQLPLFAEDLPVTKRDRFREDLCAFIRDHRPTNCELTHFCYRSGFSKKKAGEVLEVLSMEGIIVVWDNAKQKLAIRNAFYLGHECCKSEPAKVTFFVREDAPHV